MLGDRILPARARFLPRSGDARRRAETHTRKWSVLVCIERSLASSPSQRRGRGSLSRWRLSSREREPRSQPSPSPERSPSACGGRTSRGRAHPDSRRALARRDRARLREDGVHVRWGFPHELDPLTCPGDDLSELFGRDVQQVEPGVVRSPYRMRIVTSPVMRPLSTFRLAYARSASSQSTCGPIAPRTIRRLSPSPLRGAGAWIRYGCGSPEARSSRTS